MYSDDYIRGYSEGFRNALDSRDNFKTVIFGMDVGEVLKILGEHVRKKENEKMTRPIVYIRRDAFEELKQYVGVSDKPYHKRQAIQTYNFIFMPEKMVIDVNEEEGVIVKRHGKTVYED